MNDGAVRFRLAPEQRHSGPLCDPMNARHPVPSASPIPPSGRRQRRVGLRRHRTPAPEVVTSKSADKPKKQLKKKPQRTLKERRSEKRAAKKLGSSSLLRADD